MASFKEVAGLKKEQIEQEEKEQLTASKAAAAILGTHSTKDARLSCRINSDLLGKFTAINRKLGSTNGSVVNSLIARYIMENKNLLEEDF